MEGRGVPEVSSYRDVGMWETWQCVAAGHSMLWHLRLCPHHPQGTPCAFPSCPSAVSLRHQGELLMPEAGKGPAYLCGGSVHGTITLIVSDNLFLLPFWQKHLNGNLVLTFVIWKEKLTVPIRYFWDRIWRPNFFSFHWACTKGLVCTRQRFYH